MEMWNESFVRVTLGGQVGDADDLKALVDAIEVSGLDLVPLRIDTAEAVAEAVEQGRTLILEAEDGNPGRISDFERAVHRMCLECVVTEKVPGATTIRWWDAGQPRPRIVNLDSDGRKLVDATMVEMLSREGRAALSDYLEEVRRTDHGNVAPLAARPESVREFREAIEAPFRI